MDQHATEERFVRYVIVDLFAEAEARRFSEATMGETADTLTVWRGPTCLAIFSKDAVRGWATAAVATAPVTDAEAACSALIEDLAQPPLDFDDDDAADDAPND